MVDDVGNGLHHFSDICNDAFYVTTLQRRYGTYCCKSTGRNCVMGKTMVAA